MLDKGGKTLVFKSLIIRSNEIIMMFYADPGSILSGGNFLPLK